MLGSDDASIANEGNDEYDDDETVEVWADVGGDSDADETEARTRADGGSAHYSGGAREGDSMGLEGSIKAEVANKEEEEDWIVESLGRYTERVVSTWSSAPLLHCRCRV